MPTVEHLEILNRAVTLKGGYACGSDSEPKEVYKG